MDVVYILSNQSDHNYNQLRWSLRTLRNIKHENVYIVGGYPSWLCNVAHIEADDDNRPAINTYNKVIKACKNKNISDDFILMNDDFYFLRKQKVQNYYQDLESYIAERKQSTYIQMITDTLASFKNPKVYSMHTPMIINKDKFLRMKHTLGESFRNNYGNTYEIKASLIRDVKAHTIDDLASFTGEKLLSTSSTSGNSIAFVAMMQEFKCCDYEQKLCNEIVYTEKSFKYNGERLRALQYHRFTPEVAQALVDIRIARFT